MSKLDEYKFDEFISLKQFLFLPSSSLYRKLKPLAKEQFGSNERIVFFYQGPIPWDLVAHLQRVIWHLDITNCFVAICNTDPSTAQQLEIARTKYTNDTTSIEVVELDVEDSNVYHCDVPPLLNPPDSLCMYPWTNLEIKPVGEVRTCCVIKSPLSEGNNVYNINNDPNLDIQRLYFHQDLQNLRQQFRQGTRPESCSKCWKEEDAGKVSDRLQYANYHLKHKVFDIDYESEDSHNLLSLDLKLGNICNLGCRICNPQYSSIIAAESLNKVPTDQLKTHPVYMTNKLSSWPKTHPTFWDSLEKILPNIQYLQISGGEPFLLPKHFDLLELLAIHGYASNIELRYNSNGTVLPDQKVFDVWKKFKSVKIGFSIDNIGQRLEVERNHLNWSEVQSNLEEFSKHRSDKFLIEISPTVNVQNVYYLPEIYQWYKKQNFSSLWFNMVYYDPIELSIQNLTPRAKLLVIEKLRSFDFGEVQDQINVFIGIIESSAGSDGVNFCNFVRKLDKRRNQDFSTTHKAIALAMGYVLN